MSHGRTRCSQRHSHRALIQIEVTQALQRTPYAFHVQEVIALLLLASNRCIVLLFISIFLPNTLQGACSNSLLPTPSSSSPHSDPGNIRASMHAKCPSFAGRDRFTTLNVGLMQCTTLDIVISPRFPSCRTLESTTLNMNPIEPVSKSW